MTDRLSFRTLVDTVSSQVSSHPQRKSVLAWCSDRLWDVVGLSAHERRAKGLASPVALRDWSEDPGVFRRQLRDVLAEIPVAEWEFLLEWLSGPSSAPFGEDPAGTLRSDEPGIRTPVTPAAEAPLTRLGRLARGLADLRMEIEVAVANARSAGATWGEIGDEMEVSAQVAHKRYAKVASKRGTASQDLPAV